MKKANDVEPQEKKVSQKDLKINEKAEEEKNSKNLIEKMIFWLQQDSTHCESVFLGLIRERDIFTSYATPIADCFQSIVKAFWKRYLKI